MLAEIPVGMFACQPINQSDRLSEQHGRMHGGEPANRHDGSAVIMARKLTGKPTGRPEKEKIQLTLEPDIAHKLRLAALGHKMDLSEFVTNWIVREFSGLHIRGLEKQNPEAIIAGQGGLGQPATVRINTPLNRISDIHNRSTTPVDQAIDRITDPD